MTPCPMTDRPTKPPATRREPSLDPIDAPGNPNRFVAEEDEIEMGGIVRVKGSLPPSPEQLRRKP